MVCHPVVIGTKTDDISWYILTSLHSRLDPVLRYVEFEFAVRDLAVFWDEFSPLLSRPVLPVTVIPTTERHCALAGPFPIP